MMNQESSTPYTVLDDTDTKPINISKSVPIHRAIPRLRPEANPLLVTIKSTRFIFRAVEFLLGLLAAGYAGAAFDYITGRVFLMTIGSFAVVLSFGFAMVYFVIEIYDQRFGMEYARAFPLTEAIMSFFMLCLLLMASILMLNGAREYFLGVEDAKAACAFGFTSCFFWAGSIYFGFSKNTIPLKWGQNLNSNQNQQQSPVSA